MEQWCVEQWCDGVWSDGVMGCGVMVLEYWSVVSQNTVLVSSGDYVELVISQCNVSPIFT